MANMHRDDAIEVVAIPPGTRVTIHDPVHPGAILRTWTMTEARDLGQGLRIRCVGAGEIKVHEVKIDG